LAVTEDGTPDTTEILIPEPSPDAAPHSQ
jgi:hypothetical protein